jgi:DNA polymerase III gamma/tau subunit
LHRRLEACTPPYHFDISNLVYAIDTEEKLLPHLITGFEAKDLRIRPFEECPRGQTQVQTENLDLAKHIMDLDGDEILSRALRVRIHRSRGGAPSRGGRRGGRRGDRGDRGGSHRNYQQTDPTEPERKEPPKERPKFVNTKKDVHEQKTDQGEEQLYVSFRPVVTSPFGAARPVDTKSKELEFEERKKQEPADVPPPVVVQKPVEKETTPVRDPDWDFSDETTATAPKAVQAVPPKVFSIQTSQTKGKAELVIKEEPKEPKEPPKPRARAWTSEAEDRNVLSKPAIPTAEVVPQERKPQQPTFRGGRKPLRQ